MPDKQTPAVPVRPTNRLLRLAGPLLLITILTAASLYAFSGFGNRMRGDSAGAASCSAAKTLAKALSPLTTGEIAALKVEETPRPMPQLSFQTAKGESVSLEKWRGRTVLLNLWATWCAPCRAEMPALDALQAALGGPDFEVVAVNIDTRNPEKPRAFLEEIRIAKLGFYADPSARIFQDLKAAGLAFGMPTTVLIDQNGCILASLAGPAEWASPEALAFIKAALRRG